MDEESSDTRHVSVRMSLERHLWLEGRRERRRVRELREREREHREGRLEANPRDRESDAVTGISAAPGRPARAPRCAAGLFPQRLAALRPSRPSRCCR